MADDTSSPVGRTEQRLWGLLVAAFFLLGGWWLQNQYDTTIRLQEQFSEYMRFVDDRYVEKDYLSIITQRLDRIDKKLDDMRDKAPPDRY